ncbi:MAG: hypothetical protein ACM3IH_20905 [Sphingobacteriales bacterium]|jgi:hypothetical protein
MEKSFVTGAWQQTRAFSPAVITKGEQTIVWVAGYTGAATDDGGSLAGLAILVVAGCLAHPAKAQQSNCRFLLDNCEEIQQAPPPTAPSTRPPSKPSQSGPPRGWRSNELLY